ncbi:377_t:CDS:2 [Acaulospora morrowiae]|uniref:377_t:CDS:1 n=1 Tax=Acaulospora morrowiae TaxID=94023 RepID=A0A9N9FMD3_9GLOM|nr:377_t:CDS:2 [Acaulospora morrowiae]
MDEKLSNEWTILAAKGISVSATEEVNEIQNLDLTSDASDEILSEHLLRDLTRAYIGIFDQVYAPTSKKQTDDKVVHASENTELKEYILNYMSITEPFLMSLCHLLTFKDSVTCVRTAQLFSRILPSLVEREILREFVGKALLTAALQALHDGYHKEVHPVIISLITDIYIDLRPVSHVPYETFAQLLNMDHTQLQEFETSLGQATESKSRKNIVKKFLEGITGLSTGEWFKVPDTSSTVSTRRVIYGNYEKPQLGLLDVVGDSAEVGIERWFD